MKKLYIYLTIIITIAVVVVLGILGVGQSRKGILIGTVTDALSGDPVYKARIIVAGRSTIRYMDKNFQITNLSPGNYELKVSAPGYESGTREVTVRRGTTLIDIHMRGTEIPGLGHIIVFADSIKAKGIQIEIRFVNKQGIGIKHFPRLPMTMDAKLHIMLGTREKYTRGRLIYSGPIKLSWDSEASMGKNVGIISKNKLQINPETYGRFGILDVVLHTDQGDFKDTITDILLEW